MYLLDDMMPPMMTKNRLWTEMLTGEERPESIGGLILILVLLLHVGVFYLIKSSNPAPVAKPEKIMEVTLVAVPLPVADVPPPLPLPKIEPPKPIIPPKPLPPPPKPIVKPKPVIKPKPVLKKSDIPKPAPTPDTKPIVEPTPYVPPVHVATPAPAKAAPAVSKPQPVKETVTQATVGANYASNPKPKYPSVARSRGWTGKVILQVRVSADGEAEQVTVAQSSGHDILDEAAVNAVEGWRFKPATRGDTPISSTVRVPINFQLDN